MIDTAGLSERLLSSAQTLVPLWLPDGGLEADQWTARNPRGEGIAYVNMRTGSWSCGGASGTHLHELYAHLRDLAPEVAARELASLVGLGDAAVKLAATGPDGEPDRKWVRPIEQWHPVAPVAHVERGKPMAKSVYRDADGKVLGYSYLYRDSKGEFKRLPLSLWHIIATGELRWRWANFPIPRPLFGLDKLALWPDRPVVVVPFEDNVNLLEAMKISGPQGTFVAVSWPGGERTFSRADWKPVAGRTVIVWPEKSEVAVALAQKLIGKLQGIATRAEVLDVYTLGPDWAPGASPMEVPHPDWIRIRQALEAAVAKPVPPGAEEAPAYIDVQDDGAWRRLLIRKQSNGLVQDCRENVSIVLRHHPAWRGRLGWSDFAFRPEIRGVTPWYKSEGEFDADDTFELGLWLAQACGFTIASAHNIESAVVYMARLHPFHPVCEYLRRCKFDGTPRLDTWFVDCTGAQDTEYHRLVGRYLIMNMVRRVLEPGCIMRQVTILEGVQNKGKSTLIHILAAPWSVDTPFVIGNKDTFQAFRNCWAYEIAEFDSFDRVSERAVKAMVSSRSDRFRDPYAKQMKDWPRQLVFIATVNDRDRYLRDRTGNTRYYPTLTTELRLDRVAAWRDSLFAEALLAVEQGQRAYPAPDVEKQLFEPEQDLRLVEDPWESVILRWVKKIESDPVSEYIVHRKGRRFLEFTTADVLMRALSSDPSRWGPAGIESRRVHGLLREMGFTNERSSTIDKSDGARPHLWTRPIDAEPTGPASTYEDVPF